ncbi:DUF192 domain-containing protein [Halorussus halobius]|uniref:DUF192 domain-containing protein n=1 Tax=Halorussus halobius TaxID=1710537 RepID=UPI00109276CF|nr:DUF192 domain-containing protein [Halorussus halobius]
MKPYALLLVGTVLLGGCLGGVTVSGGGQAETTTEAPTAQATTLTDGSADRTSTDEPTTTADCGRAPAETRTEATADDARETSAGTATTTLPATTDADENVTATFLVDGCPNVAVSLLVADEPDERRQGLMYRQSLPHRTGMVFVYDDAAPRTFWMKNTYVPLDIIFVAPNGTVLNVEHAQPQPHAPDSAVDRYSSEGDATYVVELERGFANRTGVGPGSELVFDGTTPEAGPEAVSETS